MKSTRSQLKNRGMASPEEIAACASLAAGENAERILHLLHSHSGSEIIVWKVLLCLSAFPVPEAVRVLEGYAVRDDIFGKEAQRSLHLVERKEFTPH